MPTLVAVEALGGVGGEAAARLTTTIAHVPVTGEMVEERGAGV